MALVRHYIVETGDDKVGTLRGTLRELRDFVAGCAGSVRVDRLGRMFFIEHWSDKAHHAAATRHLPPAAMAALRPMLVASPAMADLVDAGHAP